MTCCKEPTEPLSPVGLPYQQLTKFEMAQNFLGALKRLSEDRARAFGLVLKGDFSKLSYRVSERTYIERLICCTTCRATNKCPYCGCHLVGKRFSKSVLLSEVGCPNPQTYPNLRRYPPRNYWQVCNEKTTIIIPARKEPLDLNRTLHSLIDNATGRIEIIVVLDGCDHDVIKHRLVKIIRHKEPQGRRHSINEAAKQAKGQYLFHLDIDADCPIGEGFDTKLKCACEDRAIAVSIICGTKLSKTIPMGCSACIKVSAKVGCQILNHVKTARDRMRSSLSFISLAWMIKKKYFWELGGYDVSPSACGYDEPEWSLRVWLHERQPGKVFLLNENYKLPAEI